MTAPDADRLVKSRRPFPSLDVVFHVSFEHFVPRNARRRTRVSEVDGQDRSGVELCDFDAVEDLAGVSAVGKQIVLGASPPACAAEFDLREDAGSRRSRVAYIPRKDIIDEANGPINAALLSKKPSDSPSILTGPKSGRLTLLQQRPQSTRLKRLIESRSKKPSKENLIEGKSSRLSGR